MYPTLINGKPEQKISDQKNRRIINVSVAYSS